MKDEVQFAINLTHRVFMSLITRYDTIFPQKKEPWYQPDNEDGGSKEGLWTGGKKAVSISRRANESYRIQI